MKNILYCYSEHDYSQNKGSWRRPI